MDSCNDWQRDKAQQLLLWNIDKSAIPLLEKLSKESSIAEARGQALATLSAMHALSPDYLMAALHDPAPRVRELAVRLAEEQPSNTLLTALTAMCTTQMIKFVCSWRWRWDSSTTHLLASR